MAHSPPKKSCSSRCGSSARTAQEDARIGGGLATAPVFPAEIRDNEDDERGKVRPRVRLNEDIPLGPLTSRPGRGWGGNNRKGASSSQKQSVPFERTRTVNSSPSILVHRKQRCFTGDGEGHTLFLIIKFRTMIPIVCSCIYEILRALAGILG